MWSPAMAVPRSLPQFLLPLVAPAVIGALGNGMRIGCELDATDVTRTEASLIRSPVADCHRSMTWLMSVRMLAVATGCRPARRRVVVQALSEHPRVEDSKLDRPEEVRHQFRELEQLAVYRAAGPCPRVPRSSPTGRRARGLRIQIGDDRRVVVERRVEPRQRRDVHELLASELATAPAHPHHVAQRRHSDATNSGSVVLAPLVLRRFSSPSHT